jgi:NitT/TauT family transport system permease protein
LALWEWGNQLYGKLVLPAPMDAFATLGRLFDNGQAAKELLVTGWRALAGFLLSITIGTVLGITAGLSVTASMMSRPIVTLLVGIPPIAWIVIALLWFGATDMAPIFTVLIACFPIVFVGALQGARTLDSHLKDMASAFRLPPWMKFTDVYLPHIISYVFPAWISALGMSWKIVVMAELLATSDGVGAALAVSRSHLDTAATMAWIVAIVGLLLAVEYLLLEPLKRQIEQWRDSESD